jgi:site-specific recombinase XerC
MNYLVPIISPALPALITAAGERASTRLLEFFAANIRNPHTRRAYYRAAEEFLAWCADAGLPSIAAVQPVHVATWIEVSSLVLAAPSVKQRLAALRHLFDWLVNGQVLPVNPAHTVRGPRHVVTWGQTPVLNPAEARALLDSIDISTHVGLRDRALIGLMVYSFARIGAALGMAVEDVYRQNRRLWVRLREGRQAARDAVPSQPRRISRCLSRWRRSPRRSQGAAVPHNRPRHRQADAHGAAAGERLRSDPPARRSGRHQNQARQPQRPGNRDHRLS